MSEQQTARESVGQGMTGGWVSIVSTLFHQWAKGWLILVVFVLLAGFMAMTLPRLQAVSSGIEGLDTMFFYTPDEAYENLASYSTAGRETLLSFHITTDLVNPVLYGLFLVLLLSWIFQRVFSRRSKLQTLNLIPLGAVIFDFSENVCIALMISRFPRQIEELAWLSTFSTMLKLSLIYLAAALILLAAGAWLLRRTRGGVTKFSQIVRGK